MEAMVIDTIVRNSFIKVPQKFRNKRIKVIIIDSEEKAKPTSRKLNFSVDESLEDVVPFADIEDSKSFQEPKGKTLAMILTDTCVLIEFFKERKDTVRIIKKNGTKNIVLNSIITMELISGARNKIELNSLKKRLNKFEILDIDQLIMDEANQLLEKFHLSHGLKIPDAVIAATAKIYDVPLFTYNYKDFRFIEGLTLFRGD